MLAEAFEYDQDQALPCHGCGRRFNMTLRDVEILDYKSHYCSRCRENFHFYAVEEEKSKP